MCCAHRSGYFFLVEINGRCFIAPLQRYPVPERSYNNMCFGKRGRGGGVPWRVYVGIFSGLGPPLIVDLCLLFSTRVNYIIACFEGEDFSVNSG